MASGPFFSLRPPASGTVTPTVQKLLGNPGAKPYYGQLTELNGKLYSMTRNGGLTD